MRLYLIASHQSAYPRASKFRKMGKYEDDVERALRSYLIIGGIMSDNKGLTNRLLIQSASRNTTEFIQDISPELLISKTVDETFHSGGV